MPAQGRKPSGENVAEFENVQACVRENGVNRKSKKSAPPSLENIERLNTIAESRWASRFLVDKSLTRAAVSFQANKSRAVYRWYKYKEAFSAGLVEYLLDKYRLTSGTLLDPFAGSGTALFAAGERGLKAEGIELLPIGSRVISTKRLIEYEFKTTDIEQVAFWAEERPWRSAKARRTLNELKITRGAYPTETVDAIEHFWVAADNENPRVANVLQFALLCILEAISFTRKDGQYLRWDYRSGRRQGAKIFDKGAILSFDRAMSDKLREIVEDLSASQDPSDLFGGVRFKPDVVLHEGSCLELMPTLPSGHYDCIVTSPPYCNRYDYTRTYALELAMLGVDETALLTLRQNMLSCTVENREKDLIRITAGWERAISVANKHALLKAILDYLDHQKELELLNNNSIPRMVKGYFFEMACVIAECARVLKPGAPLLMVNDNVRYSGASISVDIILSEFAEQLGFETKQILVLPNGKGNSSQQMGLHGRDALRKCVYIWRRM
jgi:DNA modification methylase